MDYNKDLLNVTAEALEEFINATNKNIKDIWFTQCSSCSGFIPTINGIINLKDSYKRATVNQCYETKHTSCYPDLEADYYTAQEKALYKFRLAYDKLLRSASLDEQIVEDYAIKGHMKDYETRKIVNMLLLMKVDVVVNEEYFKEKQDHINKSLGYSLTQNISYHHKNGVMPSINKAIQELNWLKIIRRFVLTGKNDVTNFTPRYDQLPQNTTN